MAYRGLELGPDLSGYGELFERLYRVERKLDLLLGKLDVDFDESAALRAAAIPVARVAAERGDEELAVELQQEHTGVSRREAVMITQAMREA